MKADEIMQTKWPAHRILVVEDEPMMRHFNSKMLMDAGYNVEAAEDGAVAWDALQLKNFDLLITDNSMPKVTGLELIEKVRGAGMALPVIMTTGILPKEAFARSPWLRPAATLLKPYTPGEFLDAVRSVLCATAPIVIWQPSESASTSVAAAQRFVERNGKTLPVPPTSFTEDFSEFDELQAITEVMSLKRLSPKT